MLLWLKTKLASNYATSAFNIYYETGSKIGKTRRVLPIFIVLLIFVANLLHLTERTKYTTQDFAIFNKLKHNKCNIYKLC